MTFRDLLVEREALNQRFHARLHALTTGYQADLAADFRRAFPAKRWHLRRAAMCPNQARIHAHWMLKVETAWEAHECQHTWLKELMTVAAMREAIPRTEDLHLHVTISASSYHTQGFGASRYAEAAAEQHADQARLYGIPVEVRPVGDPHTDQWEVRYQDYGVFAVTDEVGWEMLELRPGPSLREGIRLSWARHVNPRVFNPWLPPGLEETLGLDYFGNEICPALPTIPIVE